jgi:hypothetical protein
MALTLRKLAIKDPESTDMVILTNILEGVDGSSAMGFTQEGEEARVEDNQTMEHTHLGELDIKVLRLPSSELTTLRSFVGKRVEVSGWTIEGFFRFRDNPIMNQHDDFNSAIMNDRIFFTTTAIKGYVAE